MILSFLAIAASVSATFIPGGKTPKTGNRVHNMFTASSQIGDAKYGDAEEGFYAASGDLASADFWGMFDGYNSRYRSHVDLVGQQGQRDETWFYYQSPFRDAWQDQGDYPWYRVIYMPWFVGKFSDSATGEAYTINGTEVYTVGDCDKAVNALLDSTIDDAEKETLKDDCEVKCVLFSEDTDWFNKRNCSDPAGSLHIGWPGSGHPWLQPLFDFENEVKLKIANGEETNFIFDFVPPHEVGSKIMAPETQDDVNTTQIENAQQLMHDLNPHLFGNMTVTVVDGHVVHGAVVNGAVVNETDVDEPVVTTTAAATTTTTVKVSEEESGFLINSVSISLLAAMTIFN